VVGAILAAAAVAGLVIALARGAGEDGAQEDASRTNRGFAAKRALPATKLTELTVAAEAAGCGLRRYPSEGRDHVAGQVRYRANPPTSGPHSPTPAGDGIYADPPPTEELVHSLEHGRVIIQYQEDVRAEAKVRLRALYREDPRHVILTPNDTGMRFEVAATAWRHRLGCPQLNDRVYDALRAFRERYRDRAPERVP